MIELNDIFFAYDNTQVLKGINLKVEKGEIISIVGASGAGKTTLLHILGTLEKPQKGDYLINNNSVIDLDSNQLAKPSQFFSAAEISFIFLFKRYFNFEIEKYLFFIWERFRNFRHF